MGRRIRLVLGKDQAVDAENKVDTYEQSDEISDEVDASWEQPEPDETWLKKIEACTSDIIYIYVFYINIYFSFGSVFIFLTTVFCEFISFVYHIPYQWVSSQILCENQSIRAGSIFCET